MVDMMLSCAESNYICSFFSEGREMKMVGDTKLVLLVPSCVDGWTATGGLVAPARGR